MNPRNFGVCLFDSYFLISFETNHQTNLMGFFTSHSVKDFAWRLNLKIVSVINNTENTAGRYVEKASSPSSRTQIYLFEKRSILSTSFLINVNNFLKTSSDEERTAFLHYEPQNFIIVMSGISLLPFLVLKMPLSSCVVSVMNR